MAFILYLSLPACAEGSRVVNNCCDSTMKSTFSSWGCQCHTLGYVAIPNYWHYQNLTILTVKTFTISTLHCFACEKGSSYASWWLSSLSFFLSFPKAMETGKCLSSLITAVLSSRSLAQNWWIFLPFGLAELILVFSNAGIILLVWFLWCTCR